VSFTHSYNDGKPHIQTSFMLTPETTLSSLQLLWQTAPQNSSFFIQLWVHLIRTKCTCNDTGCSRNCILRFKDLRSKETDFVAGHVNNVSNVLSKSKSQHRFTQYESKKLMFEILFHYKNGVLFYYRGFYLISYTYIHISYLEHWEQMTPPN